MKLIHCPLNGPRNAQEFLWGGAVKTLPDPLAGSDRDWADYVFLEDNPRGLVREWWCHVPTHYWFIAERDTISDEFIRTYPAAELYPRRRDFGTSS